MAGVTRTSGLLVFAALAAGACTDRKEGPRPPPVVVPVLVASLDGSTGTDAGVDAAADAGVDARSATEDALPPLVPDEELGPLIARLSESPGDFPSDNFVSNETSYLDVVSALSLPALHGRAYVGVGPEQNLTYLALLEPAVAYIVDIRRGNLLEHIVLRGCFEAGATRAGFLSALLARHPRPARDGSPDAGEVDGFEPLAEAFASARPDPGLLDEGIARSRALLDRLHVTRAPHDDANLARIHRAFFARGLLLAFEMKNSGLVFPTLGAILATRDPGGVEASFLASEARYQRVRRRVLANRVVPVVGDFAGRHALGAVADDMRARGVVLGVFYASNVEQYLFQSHTYPAFVANVAAMPRDDASLLVRVWLDPFKAHPLQRPGHKTTTLTAGASAFVARAQARPYASYWEVVTAP